MRFRDSALVATFLMLLSTCTLFFPTHSYDVMLADVSRYAYDLLTFLFSSWITFFGSLTGLMAYTNRKTESTT